MQPNILAIDSSSATRLCIGIRYQGQCLELSLDITRKHERLLMPSVLSSLQLLDASMDEIDLFAASVGPGSFTGIRVGLACIRSLAWALKKPCLGLDALELLRMRTPSPLTRGQIAVVCQDAGAHTAAVFAALFGAEGTLQSSAETDVPSLIHQLATLGEVELFFVGQGALRHRSAFEAGLAKQAWLHFSEEEVRGQDLCALAAKYAHLASTPQDVLPMYLRESHAERSQHTQPSRKDRKP